jgi:hypothetical protein
MPGDQQTLSPPAMHTLAGDLSKASTSCTDLSKWLSNPLDQMWWKSRAATGFKEDITEVCNVLNRLSPLLAAVSKDVDARAKQLEVSRND